MFGAIAGGIIGSVFERHNVKHTAFTLFSEGFTDDKVLTFGPVGFTYSTLEQ